MREFPVDHTVSEVICIRCMNRWISVRPSSVLLKDLECPSCKNHGYTIETGQVIDEGENSGH